MYRRGLLLVVVAALMTALAGRRPADTRATSHPQEQAKSSHRSAPDKRDAETTNEFSTIRRQAEAARKKAFDHGEYACCVAPACSWCLLSMGKCTCALGVGRGQYACRECKGGWESGQGRIPGKTKEDVRKMKTIYDVAESQTGPSGPEQNAETKATVGSRQKSGRENIRDVASGEKLFQTNNCLSCHTMQGKGGTGGPDLTHEALRHADIAWQIEHLKQPAKVHPGSTMPSYAHLRPEALQALAAYLASRQ